MGFDKLGVSMKKKITTPQCQILIPAPWQKSKTDEMLVDELIQLVWSIEESITPISEVSEEISETMNGVD